MMAPATHALIGALLLLPGTAFGQTFTDVARQLGDDRAGYADRPGLRVSETFVVQTPPVPVASLEEQKASIQSTHKILFEIISRECDLLSDAFKMDCRITTLNLNDSNQGFRNQSGTMPWSATALFDLRPRSQVKGDGSKQ